MSEQPQDLKPRTNQFANSKPKVTQWLRQKKRSLLNADWSAYDKRLIRKLL